MDQDRPSGEIQQPVNSISELRFGEHDLDSILAQIGRLGVQALPGWDAAATSMVKKNKVATFGATDERVNALDQFQYDQQRGPCVDALQGEINYFNGDDVPDKWRQFANAAADNGVASVVSFPLRLDDQVIGAMNFYSREKDALREGQREEGLLFASQAAVALANAESFAAAGTQLEQLQEAIETRTMIGQATGLLMAQEGLTSDEAFAKLVKVSQNANIKLRDIARRYVEAWEDNPQRSTTTQ